MCAVRKLIAGAILAFLASYSIFAADSVSLSPDGMITSVGHGRIPEGLRGDRARRFAVMRAERDAKRRMARFLNPDAFAGNKPVRYNVRGARILSEKEVSEPWPAMEITLAANAADVVVTPVSAIEPLASATDIWLRDEAFACFELDQTLADGGGAIFPRGDGWIAIGVGLAFLEDDESAAAPASLRRAKTVARVEAGKALAESVFGVNIEHTERDQERVFLDAVGKTRFSQWMRQETRETVEGRLRRAELAGRWITEDRHLAVALAVAVPPLPPVEIGETETDTVEEKAQSSGLSRKFSGWTVAPEWEAALAANPVILTGGAALTALDGAPAVIGVGAAPLKGDARHDRLTAPLLAENDARRRMTAYLSGSEISSVIKDIEEYELHEGGGSSASEQYTGTVLTRMREKVNGSLAGMRKIGEWRSPEGTTLYIAYAVSGSF